METKAQISCAVISAFVFATKVKPFSSLNTQFRAPRHLLWTYSLVENPEGRFSRDAAQIIKFCDSCLLVMYMTSRVMRKPTFWFPTWSDTNQAVQLQKMAGGSKFRISKVEGLHYLSIENKGADNCAADLCLCFHKYKKQIFS